MGGIECDTVVKNENGRLSLETMTSFLSLSLSIARQGKKFHLASIRKNANLRRGGTGDHRGYTHVSVAATLWVPSNLDV